MADLMEMEPNNRFLYSDEGITMENDDIPYYDADIIVPPKLDSPNIDSGMHDGFVTFNDPITFTTDADAGNSDLTGFYPTRDVSSAPSVTQPFFKEATEEAWKPGPRGQARIFTDKDRGRLLARSQGPSVSQLYQVSVFLAQLFQRRGVPLAFSGAWALFLRGSQQPPQSVEIVIGAKMKPLEAVLLTQSNVSIPIFRSNSRMEIFVVPDAENPFLARPVRVALIVQGKHRMPESLPRGTVEIMAQMHPGLLMGPVPVINICHHLDAALEVHTSSHRRRLRHRTEWEDPCSAAADAYAGLQFLVCQHGNVVKAASSHLPYASRISLYLDWVTEEPAMAPVLQSTLAVNGNDTQDIARFYRSIQPSDDQVESFLEALDDRRPFHFEKEKRAAPGADGARKRKKSSY